VVQTRVLPYQQAISAGALAFFDEKYGDEVRVLSVGPQAVSTLPEDLKRPFSVELCGGTHLRATGEAGLFSVVSEGSVGAGVRRIEAVVGGAAERSVAERVQLLNRLAQRIGGQPQDLEQRLNTLVEELESERRRAEQMGRQAVRTQVDELAEQVRQVDGALVLAGQVTVPDVDALGQAGDWLRDRVHQGVVVLGTVLNDKPSFLVVVTPDLVGRGLHAGKIANQIAGLAGGKAGGRPERATGGGGDVSRLPAALAAVENVVRAALVPS
jgi:alanyl-tRNA synthetase